MSVEDCGRAIASVLEVSALFMRYSDHHSSAGEMHFRYTADEAYLLVLQPKCKLFVGENHLLFEVLAHVADDQSFGFYVRLLDVRTKH